MGSDLSIYSEWHISNLIKLGRTAPKFPHVFSPRAKRYVASRKLMRAAGLNSYVGVKVALLVNLWPINNSEDDRESACRRWRFPP